MNPGNDILIVVDDVGDRAYLTELLEREGYHVRSAPRRRDAIDLALAEPPELILLDVRLPGMDGLEICHRLMADERTRAVPIIVIGALHDLRDWDPGMPAGGADFIAKPLHEHEVLARVRTHARLRSAQRQLTQLPEEQAAKCQPSDMRFASLVEHSNEAIAVAQDDRVVYCNPRFSELIGFTQQELHSLDLVELVHQDDRSLLLREYESRLTGDNPSGTYPIRIVTKAGQERRVQISATSIGWAGRPASAAFVADITEQELTRESLERSEEKFRGLMEQSPLATALLSPEGRITEVNPAWYRQWDVSREEAAKVWANYDFRADRQLLEIGAGPLIERAFAGEHVVLPPVEYVGKRAMHEMGLGEIDPNTVWIQTHLYPVKDGNGDIEYIVGTNLDITEPQRAREKLVHSEEKFRGLMAQSPLAVEILSPDGRIRQFNAAWLRLWHITKDDAKEAIEHYNMLTDEQVIERGLGPLVLKAFAGESVVLPPFEYDFGRALDEIGLPHIRARSPWIQCHLYPIKDVNGEVSNVVNTYVDITELRQAEHEVSDHREALARLDRITSMGQLTGSIAHELNQPLTGILSNAQSGEILLRRGECVPEDMATIMADIVADAKRAGDVIHDLRNLYRRQRVEQRRVDLNRVVDHVVQLLKSEFVLQHVLATRRLEPALPEVTGNAVQLEQVLMNIALNSIDAMRDLPSSARRLRVCTASGGGQIKVWVRDRGPGIEADNLNHIFEPFATWKPGGTGMGLAVSNTIVQSHRGHMWAENPHGGGARVGFALPVRNEANEEQ